MQHLLASAKGGEKGSTEGRDRRTEGSCLVAGQGFLKDSVFFEEKLAIYIYIEREREIYIYIYSFKKRRF